MPLLWQCKLPFWAAILGSFTKASLRYCDQLAKQPDFSEVVQADPVDEGGGVGRLSGLCFAAAVMCQSENMKHNK